MNIGNGNRRWIDDWEEEDRLEVEDRLEEEESIV
jgi:hypothetical protein